MGSKRDEAWFLLMEAEKLAHAKILKINASTRENAFEVKIAATLQDRGISLKLSAENHTEYQAWTAQLKIAQRSFLEPMRLGEGCERGVEQFQQNKKARNRRMSI